MSNRIKNWKDFQHFKDRCPPWIKLHRSLLDQRDIAVLSDGAFRVLIMLWLLASEDKEKKGELPSIEDISFRTRKPKDLIQKYLKELSSFLISDDIATISQGYRVGPPETERETEKEGEIEANVITSATIKNFKSLTKQEFIDQCQKTGNTILEDVDAIAFCRYWIEPDTKGRMRFQLQKTWDTALRMHTWKRNAENMAQRKVVQ